MTDVHLLVPLRNLSTLILLSLPNLLRLAHMAWIACPYLQVKSTLGTKLKKDTVSSGFNQLVIYRRDLLIG